MAIRPDPVPDGIAPSGKPYESVWEFPRPPRLETVPWRIRVIHRGHTIVDAPRAFRILETSQPPAYYVAPEHIDLTVLAVTTHSSFCEWKGRATYADVVVGEQPAVNACWTYRQPTPAFEAITDHWAFYAQMLDECWVDDERVQPNPGNFYGGWITENVRGPFKGGPGTAHW